MELSVVIVNYRAREPLLHCLAALEADAASVVHETVVVDNDPADGALEAVAHDFPQIRGIPNRDNVGYARAVNQGIAATGGEFVLVMNPDCVVRPGSLTALIGYLRAHPRTAVAGPMILDGDGTLEYSARSFPDHLTFLFNRYSLLTRWFPGNRFSRRYLLTDWDHASVRDVDWLSGACLMVRRASIAQVGGMDEAFFMFNEDVDWCRRMKLAGWAVTYVPEARVVHHIGASRSKVAPKVILERHRGMIHYFHKHHPTHPVVTFCADALIMLRAGVMLTANALRTR
jgi:N-acetylglucosaminyl-diphospho-decaprenol L-rhamnosyltransferase